ncbi:hypothetical protein N7494_003600 [Penicillium frequentans]|uniref:Uncharacterized protein n=1 Tax=Penicillium frequentans TaxID=3151616 RepID=A0AAD6GFU7_9EURO|nr:hypothetical protein N7494_003600 [Penicillium glabrum]
MRTAVASRGAIAPRILLIEKVALPLLYYIRGRVSWSANKRTGYLVGNKSIFFSKGFSPNEIQQIAANGRSEKVHLAAIGPKGAAGQGTPVAHWRHCTHANSKNLVALPIRVSPKTSNSNAISLML